VSNGAIRHVGVAAPHFGQQRIAVEDDAAMSDEQVKEIEFLLGQFDITRAINSRVLNGLVR